MNKPKVSIIVPVYNTEKYLKRCLDSIINQTLKDIEIIVVNDGSTDNSGEILEEYSQKDHRIKVFTQKNQGPSVARNKGIKESHGKYLQFVDSDDQLELDAIETLYNKAEQNNLDMIMFNIKPKLIDENNRKQYEDFIQYYKRNKTYSNIITGQEMFYEMRKNHDYLPSPVIYMMKTNLVKQNHITFYEGIIHEDNLFTIQLIFKADRVQHINKNFYIRNVRNNSIMTNKVSVDNVNGLFICIRELLKLSSQLNLTNNSSEVLSNLLVLDLQGNLVKRLQQLQPSEVNTYKRKLNIEDLILFDLLTQSLVKERKKNQNSHMQKNLLPYKNTRFNRYSFKLGRKLLYFPRKIYRLMRKLGILRIIKAIYKKTISLLKNILDFFYVELNPIYRDFMKFYKNRDKYPIDYDTTLIFSKNNIPVSQSVKDVRIFTNDYTSRIVTCQIKNLNSVNYLDCKINLPKKMKRKDDKSKHFRYFNSTGSNIIEIKDPDELKNSIKKFSKKQEPLISIVMPIHNQEKYLEETITDILNQSLTNFELICVDDGSEDKTFQILISLAKKDDRIRVIAKEHENAGAARNLGSVFARGKYIIFLDSDDRFDRDLLKKMYNKIDKTNADICVCDANGFNTENGEIRYKRLLFSERLPEEEIFNRKLIKENLYLFCTPCPWNKMFKRSFLNEHNILFQNLMRTNDLLFVFHSFTKAKKITTLNEQLVHYRIGTKTNLQSGGDKTPFSLLKALLKLKDILEDEGLFTEYIEQSFVNVATTNLTYNLNTMNKKENVRIITYWLKRHGLKDLHIHGHRRDYFLYGHEKVLEKYCRIKFNKT